MIVYGGWGCGACRECARGEEQRCELSEAPGFQRDGGYAEQVLVPSPGTSCRCADLIRSRLRRWPMPALRPIAPSCGHALADPGTRVLLIGLGGLGQFAIQYLRRLPGLTIAVRELDPDKLAWPPTAGRRPGPAGRRRVTRHLGLGGHADVVFDFVGTDETLDYAAATSSRAAWSAGGEAGGRLAFGFDRPPSRRYATTAAWGSSTTCARSCGSLTRPPALAVERMPLRKAAPRTIGCWRAR